MKIIEIPQNHIFTQVSVNGVISENLKPIKIDDTPLWVIVDTKAKIEGFVLYESRDGWRVENFDHKSRYSVSTQYDVIASTKFIDKSIPVIKFVEQSVEELAELKFPYKKTTEWVEEGLAFEVDGNEDYRIGFVEGFNQAKSSDKKWSDKDVKNAYIQGRKDFYLDAYYKKHSEEYLQSLNQAKLPDVINLEMIFDDSDDDEDYNDGGFFGKSNLKLKTTSTPEGKIIEIKI